LPDGLGEDRKGVESHVERRRDARARVVEPVMKAGVAEANGSRSRTSSTGRDYLRVDPLCSRAAAELVAFGVGREDRDVGEDGAAMVGRQPTVRMAANKVAAWRVKTFS